MTVEKVILMNNNEAGEGRSRPATRLEYWLAQIARALSLDKLTFYK